MKIDTDTFHFPAFAAANRPPPPNADGENEFAAFAAQFSHRAERLREVRAADRSRYSPEPVTEVETRHTAEMWAGGLLLAGLAAAAIVIWGWPIEPTFGPPAPSGQAEPTPAAQAAQEGARLATPPINMASPQAEPAQAAAPQAAAQAAPSPPIPADTAPAEAAPPTPAPTSTAAPPSTAASASTQTSPTSGAPSTPSAKAVAASAPAATDSTPLSWDEVRDLQKRLKTTGFDPGPIDGIVGPLTRDAARRYAAALAAGNADPVRGMLVRLRAEPTQSAELPSR
jgi:hypothetical protein